MKISIVVPSFNQARWLPGCLESMLGQGYPDLELIVMDGGSNDGSVEIIKSFEDRISYWQSAPDGGQYSAIEEGLNRATGDVLAWLNADDLYLPWTLQTVASVFAQLPRVEWLTSTQAAMVSEQGAIFTGGVTKQVSKSGFLEGLYVPGGAGSLGVIVQEGTFWRKALWDRTMPRFTPAAPLAGDFELWCRFFTSSDIHNISLPLAAMTRHRNQRSNNALQYQIESNNALARLQSAKGFQTGGSWRGKLARAGHKCRVVWSLVRRICRFPVHLIAAETDADGCFSRWVTKTLPLW